MMSMENIVPERVCYVHCSFCDTTLAVSVPCNSMHAIVTVRCGHCTNLLYVNVGAAMEHLPHQDLQHINKNYPEEATGSSSMLNKTIELESPEQDQPPKMTHIRPPEKRHRVPSAYNKFIKEEIQRIKAGNPHISHREAFSTAAKNWAHFPDIRFGLKMDSNNQAQLDQAIEGDHGTQKALAFS